MNWCSGDTISISIRWYVRPGASVGTRNSAGDSLPVRWSARRATTRRYADSSTPEMKTFRPLRTYPSPSRPATVDSRWKFEPASGSVMAKQTLSVPSAKPGRNARRCAGVPCFATTVAAIAGDTTSSSSGQPAAASSSHTIASSVMPPPPPPYSTGTLTPR